MSGGKMAVFFLVVVLSLAVSGPAWGEFDIVLEDSDNYLDFGALDLGQANELAEKGGYQHEVRCTSDNENTWYLKLQVIRPFTSGVHAIPMKNFFVIVQDRVTGEGSVTHGINRELPLEATSTLIYTSSGDDNTGTRVDLRMRYRLEIPRNQVAGSYTAQFQYVMVEKL